MAGQRFTAAVAVHVLFLRDGRVLMLRRTNTGYADGLLSVPAGHLDGGETVVAAAMREVYEEVGVDLRPDEIEVAGVMHRLEGEERIDFFLAVRAWRGEFENREPEKCSELVWAPLDGLPDDTVPYVRAAIEAYRSGEWFSSYGWLT